jgi:transcriptional regulator with XRE-family HTH domain
MPTDLRDTVAAEVRAEMARRKLTQTALAALLGEQQWWVSKRLNRVIPFTIEDLDKIATALELPPTHFMRGAS